MNMKRNIAVVFAMMMTSIIFAQEKENARPHHYQGKSMSEILSLDETQSETIKKINEKYTEEQLSIRRDSTLSREDKHKTGQSLRKQREEEIKSILTPEQNEKWSNYKSERAARAKEKRTEALEKREAYLKKELSLTDEQVTKMKEAHKDIRTKMEQLRKDDKADKESFKKLKDEHESTIRSILSQEQYQKWMDQKKEFKKKGKSRKK